MTKIITKENSDIIHALRTTHGVYFDGCYGFGNVRSAKYFAVLDADSKQFVCPLPLIQVHGRWVGKLRPIYMLGNEIHLSTATLQDFDESGDTVLQAAMAFNNRIIGKNCLQGMILDVVQID